MIAMQSTQILRALLRSPLAEGSTVSLRLPARTVASKTDLHTK